MTREEAITRLKNMAWLYGSAEREQNIEAIDMAIEALSVVRCKDCRFYWGNLGEDDTDEMYGECRWDTDEMPNADDFCSYGERREPLPQYAEWKEPFEKMVESAKVGDDNE